MGVGLLGLFSSKKRISDFKTEGTRDSLSKIASN